MLTAYNTNLNNMYLNQNYGYGQQQMNPYQNYSYGQQQIYPYQQQPQYYGGYSQGYQQPTNSVDMMLLSMINTMLPAMFGSIGQQQPMVIQQPVYIQQPPVQQPQRQPQQDNSNSFLQSLVIMLLQAVLSRKNHHVEPEPPLTPHGGHGSATGDPHFGINGQQAFDFQGVNGGLYKMLENKDISLDAKFTGGGEGAATIINSQNLNFKKDDINIVSHAGGKFEIYQKGEKIADETNYNKDEKAIEILKKADINITFEGNVLKTDHDGRSLSQRLNGGNIDNIDETLMNGDKGLLTQTMGAIDDDRDGTTKMSVDINKDGKVDENDILKYEVKDQAMVHTEIQGISSKKITPEIEAAIKKDIEAGLKQGSIVKGFSTEHGYDARQWNEYVGSKLYSVKSDKYLS